MTEPDMEPMILRSVTIAEIMDIDGNKSLRASYEGDPTFWDVLGMLDYVSTQFRLGVLSFEDCDE